VERASLARPTGGVRAGRAVGLAEAGSEMADGVSQGTKCYLTNRVLGRNAADLSDVAFDRTNGRWSLECVVGAVVAGLNVSFGRSRYPTPS
jgi:hypothetical protein